MHIVMYVIQDVEKGLVKVRRKNNSKKRPAKSA